MRIVTSCVKAQQGNHGFGDDVTKLKAESVILDEEIRGLKNRLKELEAEAGEMKEELAAQEKNKRKRKREVAAPREHEQDEPRLSIPSPPPSAARHHSTPIVVTPAPVPASLSSLLKRKRAGPEQLPTPNTDSPSTSTHPTHSGMSAPVLSTPTEIPCQQVDAEEASLRSEDTRLHLHQCLPPPVPVSIQEDLPLSTTSLPPRFRFTKRKKVDPIPEMPSSVSSLSQRVSGEDRNDHDEKDGEEVIPKTKKSVSESKEEDEQIPKRKLKSLDEAGVPASSPRTSALTRSSDCLPQDSISAPTPSSSSRLPSPARPALARQPLSTASCGQATDLSSLTNSEEDESDTPILKKKRKSKTSAGSRTSKRIENRRKVTTLRALTDSEEDNLGVSNFQKMPRSKSTTTKQPANASHTPTTVGGGDDTRAKLRKRRTTINVAKDGAAGKGKTKPKSSTVASKQPLPSSSSGAARPSTTVPASSASRRGATAVSVTSEKSKPHSPRSQLNRTVSSRCSVSGSASKQLPAPSTTSRPQTETNRTISSSSVNGSEQGQTARTSSSSSPMPTSSNSNDDDVIDLTLLESDKEEEQPKEDVLVITDDSDDDGDLEILCVTLRSDGAGVKGGVTPMNNEPGNTRPRSRIDDVGKDADTGVGREEGEITDDEHDKNHPPHKRDNDVHPANVTTTTNATARGPPTPHVKADAPSSCDLEYTPPTHLHPDLIKLFYQAGKAKKPGLDPRLICRSCAQAHPMDTDSWKQFAVGESVFRMLRHIEKEHEGWYKRACAMGAERVKSMVVLMSY
ncbi:hypothetical protein AAF712_011547 [Marasmius tenuissimus]|uniref:Uncharacterized protein n=1 Tax=Marasmius tenuissimus TaxID=585030 RepID=A0ABR2ZJY3_9AGAR